MGDGGDGGGSGGVGGDAQAGEEGEGDFDEARGGEASLGLCPARNGLQRAHGGRRRARRRRRWRERDEVGGARRARRDRAGIPSG